MSVKAKLKIVLKADDTVVAECEDTSLWHKVLVAIHSTAGVSTNEADLGAGVGDEVTKDLGGSGTNKTLNAFSKEVGVDATTMKGACDPTVEAPFIHLDKHHWEALKKHLPERGSKALADIVIAATLLVLWKSKSELGVATVEEANGVLDTLKLTAKNTTRSLNNCEWLQLRGKTIVLNPARTSRAVALAKAYCLKQDPNASDSND